MMDWLLSVYALCLRNCCEKENEKRRGFAATGKEIVITVINIRKPSKYFPYYKQIREGVNGDLYILLNTKC